MLRSFIATILLGGTVASVVGQTPALPADPQLIPRLERGTEDDFRAIPNTNTARLDMAAVLWAFGQGKCRLQKSDGTTLGPVLMFGTLPSPKLASEYEQYLGSDSASGEYPSREYVALGAPNAILSPLSGVLFGLNSNATTVLAMIDAQHCEGAQIQRIGRNLIRLLDSRIGRFRGRIDTSAIGLYKSTILTGDQSSGTLPPVSASMRNESTPPTVEQRAILERLKSEQAISCTYGPTSPAHQAGFITFQFWYRSVPSYLDTVIAVYPLFKGLGTTAVQTCPASRADAEAAKRK